MPEVLTQNNDILQLAPLAAGRLCFDNSIMDDYRDLQRMGTLPSEVIIMEPSWTFKLAHLRIARAVYTWARF